MGSIPGQRTKIPHATWKGQKIFKKKKKSTLDEGVAVIKFVLLNKSQTLKKSVLEMQSHIIRPFVSGVFHVSSYLQME